MQDMGWVPPQVDVDKPSPARVYDYLLGGSHNFAVDRDLAEQALAVMPDMRRYAWLNRAFLHRAVRYLCGVGITQFIDVGSGIPTVGNVHDIAQEINPDARVAYVDIDPIAVAHSQMLLTGNDRAVAIQADARQPDTILTHPDLQALIDLDQPAALLLVAVLHYIPDADDPYGLVSELMEPLAAGSHLVISHGTQENLNPDGSAQIVGMSPQAMGLTPRTRHQITQFFTGLTLLDPGVVWLPLWHPDTPEDPDDIEGDPTTSGSYAAVGRKD